MNPSWAEVNAAVLAVLAESSRPARMAPVASSNGRADVFAERLFGLRHAEAVVEGVGEIRVARGTVVTPLALDWLRKRRVAVRVVSGREAIHSRSKHRGEWGFAIESASGQAEALRRAWLEDWAEVGGDALEAALWVVESEARGALLVTDEASVAAWRAGRVEGVRAATVAEPEAVARAIRHLGANLIVVEAAGKSIYLLKQIGERFRRGGAPTMPEGLRGEAR